MDLLAWGWPPMSSLRLVNHDGWNFWICCDYWELELRFGSLVLDLIRKEAEVEREICRLFSHRSFRAIRVRASAG